MADDIVCAQLRAELKELVNTEAVLDRELCQCFSVIAEGKSLSKGATAYESTDIRHNISKVEQFAPCYEAMVQDSKKLVHQIEECRSLSDRLSAIVRRLDMIQIRAQEALACTEDVINLKECKVGIQLALEDSDLQLAVNYIKQVHDIDERAVKASDDYGTLQQSEREVKTLVKNKFDDAISNSDIEEVLSLCPMLQIVGLEQDACDTFMNFLETNVFIGVSADAAPIENIADHATAYAQTLSSIFNTAFMIFQQYLPIVIQGMERSLGDIVFIRRLHAKCEKETGKVLKRYITYRNVPSIIAAIKKASSVASSTTATQYPKGGTGPAKGNSGGEMALIAPAEMHSLLDEIALLLQYCGSYAKYLKMLCQGAEQRDRTTSSRSIEPTHHHSHTHSPGAGGASGTGTGRARSLSSVSDSSITSTSAAYSQTTAVVFKTPTDFDGMVDELINKYYIEGEHWLILWGVNSVIGGGQATSMEGDSTSRILLDGCFFVLQKCSQRAIATGNIHAACATLHLISDHLNTDLLKYFHAALSKSIIAISSRLKDTMSRFLKSSAWYSGSDSVTSSEGSAGGSGITQGLQSALTLAASLSRNSGSGGPASGTTSVDHTEGIWGVSTHMEKFNDVEACVRYTDRLRRDITAAGGTVFGPFGPLQQHHDRGHSKHDSVKSSRSDDAAKMQLSLEDFEATKESFAQALRQAIGNLTTQCQSVMKEVLSNILSRDGPAGGIRFELKDAQFDIQPIVQMLPKLILLPFEVLVNICTDALSDSNKDLMVSMLAEAYCSALEHFMNQSSFSYAGALKLEECVRALNGMFSQASSVSLRSRFSRLREVMLVLTTDMNPPPTASGTPVSLTHTLGLSQLSEAEAQAFISLRVDF